MLKIDAKAMGFEDLNESVRQSTGDLEITNCLGQRFIGAGMGARKMDIQGVPGNAMGAYLNGGEITVHGNAQDAIGDTMNEGKIVIHGSVGDAVGYAMRGGTIYVKGDAGYRAGIHMKAYKEKKPCIVIGGKAGSFLGEYQAGGIIIVLGLTDNKKPIVSNFPCTGMHGGKMFLRSDCSDILFPDQVTAKTAEPEDMEEIKAYLEQFCENYDMDLADILDATYTMITPASKNPYKQMYVNN